MPARVQVSSVTTAQQNDDLTDHDEVSAQLFARVIGFRDNEWDLAARRRAELCLIDSLGCFSAGRSSHHYAASVAGLSSLLTLGTVVCDGALPPFAMAYLYGQAANALDYDDTLLGHPGAPVIGGLLAVAARERLSIDRLLRGLTAGYEAHWILAAAATPSAERAALVRSVGVWDTVATALAIAVARGLGDIMLERVVSAASAHSVVPYTAKWYERPVPTVKNNLGWAAAGAVLAVDLALAGHSGVTRALNGDNGMFRMAGSDRWDMAGVDISSPAVTRVGFKRFPACWHMQQYLRRFSELLASLPASAEIVEVVLEGPKDVKRFCEPAIRGSSDLAFSLPATFSLLISGIAPGPEWDTFDDHSEQLRYRSTFRYERSASRSITVRTADGREKAVSVEAGDFFEPVVWGMSETEVLAKHARLADTELAAVTSSALGASPDTVPDALYRRVSKMMTPRPS